MSDAMTVLWKELREFKHLSRKQAAQYVVAPIVVIGVAGILALQFGDLWYISMGIVFWLAAFQGFVFYLVGSADLVAGERERHTLETLLSTRLPDAAIAWGKLLFLLVIAFGTSCLLYLLGMLVVVALSGAWGWFVPILLGGVLALALVLVAAFFVGCVGFWLSCRAETVQQAAQSSVLIMMLLVLLFVAAPFGGVALIGPERLGQWALAQPGLAVTVFLGGVLLVTVLLNAAGIAWARRVFRRQRLIDRT